MAIQLRVDYQEVFADLGLRSPQRLMKMLNQKYQHEAQEGLQKVVAEGEAMAKIETNKNIIPKLAVEEMDTPNIVETILPRHGPDIEAVGSIVNIVV